MRRFNNTAAPMTVGAGGIFFLLLMTITTVPATAQSGYHWPYETWDGAYIVDLPRSATCPPLSTDMPLDVLIGYIGGDSIARTADRDALALRLRAMTWSDTLRQALRYIYAMTDYDPIRLGGWGRWTTGGLVNYYNGRTDPGVFLQSILERTRKVCPDSLRTAMLCQADVIARVHVEATQTKRDSNAVPGGEAEPATLVTCTILESIKGKRVPACGLDLRSVRGTVPNTADVPVVRAEGSAPALPGTCLQFEIAPGWPSKDHGMIRREKDSTLAQGFAGTPGPWVRPNTDYVVFLQFVGLGGDSLHTYARVLPLAWFGTACSLYPIVDGRVYDPYDDFRFGTNLTVEGFTEALRGKIHSITHPKREAPP